VLLLSLCALLGKIIKVERSTDPFVSLPEGSDWTSIGHTLQVNPSLPPFMNLSAEARAVEVLVYRFDKHKPSSNFIKNSVQSLSNMTKFKIGNEIKSYVKDLEKILHLGLPWVNSFVGEVGEGVNGSENERRYVV